MKSENLGFGLGICGSCEGRDGGVRGEACVWSSCCGCWERDSWGLLETQRGRRTNEDE